MRPLASLHGLVSSCAVSCLYLLTDTLRTSFAHRTQGTTGWRLTAHQSWRKLDCSAFRCAAESVPPAAIDSLLTAFPKRIRLALVVRVHWGMCCAPTPIRQSPQAQCSTSRWSTPMVSLYTLIRFHSISPVQAVSRKTSSCHTVGNL